MPRLTPQPWQELERVFLSLGFVFARQSGSHRVYEKAGILRPLVIPTYPDISAEIIGGLLRTAQISREDYLRVLTGN